MTDAANQVNRAVPWNYYHERFRENQPIPMAFDLRSGISAEWSELVEQNGKLRIDLYRYKSACAVAVAELEATVSDTMKGKGVWKQLHHALATLKALDEK